MEKQKICIKGSNGNNEFYSIENEYSGCKLVIVSTGFGSQIENTNPAEFIAKSIFGLITTDEVNHKRKSEDIRTAIITVNNQIFKYNQQKNIKTGGSVSVLFLSDKLSFCYNIGSLVVEKVNFKKFKKEELTKVSKGFKLENTFLNTIDGRKVSETCFGVKELSEENQDLLNYKEFKTFPDPKFEIITESGSTKKELVYEILKSRIFIYNQGFSNAIEYNNEGILSRFIKSDKNIDKLLGVFTHEIKRFELNSVYYNRKFSSLNLIMFEIDKYVEN